jgi:hypothetical protein
MHLGRSGARWEEKGVRNDADNFYARRLSVLHGEKKGGGVRPSGGEAGGARTRGKGKQWGIDAGNGTEPAGTASGRAAQQWRTREEGSHVILGRPKMNITVFHLLKKNQMA